MQSDDMEIKSVEDISTENGTASNMNNIKKRKSDRRIFATVISTGVIALLLLYSFTGSLITKIIDVTQNVDEVLDTVVLTEDNRPETWLEKYRFYNEFNDVAQWDYEKYVQPVLQRAQQSAVNNCDNYHAIIACLVPFSPDDLVLHNYANVDVDGNVAHGFIDVSFYDENVRVYDRETDQYSGEYYDETVEFYRILKDGKITTYMSLDGENWLAKEGFEFNQDNVLFDLASFVNKFNAKDSSWFPVRTNGKVSLTFLEMPYRSAMMNSDAFYYSCDAWGETHVYLHDDSYLPDKIASSSSFVNEEKLLSLFEKTKDPLLKLFCKSELTMWPVYGFEQYGEVIITVPDELQNARFVDDFSELFVDLYDAIAKYANISE